MITETSHIDQPSTEPAGGAAPRAAWEIRPAPWALALLLVAVPLLLIAVYIRFRFAGLTSDTALDFAQQGRNLLSGRGFSTSVLRPLALTHGDNPLRQPEVVSSPLYPFLLAIAFGIAGARDSTVVGVCVILYLATVLMVYLLGRRAFNSTVGLIAALLFACSGLSLEISSSGLNLILLAFLTSALLLAIYRVNADAARPEGSEARRLRAGPLLLAGSLASLIYLTDSLFFLFLPITVLAAMLPQGKRRWRAAVLATIPMLVLCGPWMARWGFQTGNPVFGLRGIELWMNTPGLYPAYSAYKLTRPELTGGAGLFQAIVWRMAESLGGIIEGLPRIAASWMLAFLLPCLLFRFSEPAANSTRKWMMWCLMSVTIGNLLFGVRMPYFAAVIPAMLVFATAFFVHSVQEARLNRQSVTVVCVFIAATVTLPLAKDLFVTGRAKPRQEKASAAAIRDVSAPDEVTIADDPYTIAWYGERPAIQLPTTARSFSELRGRFRTARWLVLSNRVAAESDEWKAIYQKLWSLNRATLQAKRMDPPKAVPMQMKLKWPADPNLPLLSALVGLQWIRPADGMDPSLVMARLSSRGASASPSSNAGGRIARDGE